MDSKVTFEVLKKETTDFCTIRDWDQFHGPKELAIGLVTEASEVLDLFRFKTDEQMREMLADPLVRERIGSELADTLFFILRFSSMYGFDISTEFRKKMELNSKKYDAVKSKGQNKKYTEY